MARVDAVEAQAEAAQEEQRQEIIRQDRRNGNGKTPNACAAGEIGDDGGHQHEEQAAANPIAALGGRARRPGDALQRQRFTAVAALGELIVNEFSAKWTLSQSHRQPPEGYGLIDRSRFPKFFEHRLVQIGFQGPIAQF